MVVRNENKGCHVKSVYSDIADLRQKHKLVVIVRDNAGENKSHEIIDFI